MGARWAVGLLLLLLLLLELGELGCGVGCMLLESGRLMLGLWLAEACAERKRALCSLLEVGWRGLGHQVLGLCLLGCCCPVVVGLEARHITALNNASWRHSIVRIGSAKGARKACAGCEVRWTLLRLTWNPRGVGSTSHERVVE